MPPRPRRPLRRRRPVEYRRLQPKTKAKLDAAGIGLEEYQQGYTLRRPPPPLRRSRLPELAHLIATGQDRPQDLRAAQRWQRSRRQRWLREGPLEGALVLGQLKSGPRTWAQVSIYPWPAPGDWVLVVTYRDGSEQYVCIPNAFAAATLFHFSDLRRRHLTRLDTHPRNTPDPLEMAYMREEAGCR